MGNQKCDLFIINLNFYLNGILVKNFKNQQTLTF